MHRRTVEVPMNILRFCATSFQTSQSGQILVEMRKVGKQSFKLTLNFILEAKPSSSHSVSSP